MCEAGCSIHGESNIICARFVVHERDGVHCTHIHHHRYHLTARTTHTQIHATNRAHGTDNGERKAALQSDKRNGMHANTTLSVQAIAVLAMHVSAMQCSALMRCQAVIGNERWKCHKLSTRTPTVLTAAACFSCAGHSAAHMDDILVPAVIAYAERCHSDPRTMLCLLTHLLCDRLIGHHGRDLLPHSLTSIAAQATSTGRMEATVRHSKGSACKQT